MGIKENNGTKSFIFLYQKSLVHLFPVLPLEARGLVAKYQYTVLTARPRADALPKNNIFINCYVLDKIVIN